MCLCHYYAYLLVSEALKSSERKGSHNLSSKAVYSLFTVLVFVSVNNLMLMRMVQGHAGLVPSLRWKCLNLLAMT